MVAVAPDTVAAEEDDHRGYLRKQSTLARGVPVHFRRGKPAGASHHRRDHRCSVAVAASENRRVVGAAFGADPHDLDAVAVVLDTGLDHSGVAAAENRGRANPPSPPGS